MSNFTNFAIKDRDSLQNWIMRKLGAPLIDVELHQDHYDDCINDAIEEFTKYFIGEKKYLGLDLTQYVEDVGFTLPDGTTGIFAITDGDASINSSSQGINTLFSVQNVMWNVGMIPYFGYGAGGGNWVTYELSMQYLDLIKRMTGGGFDFAYNSTTRNLTLIPDPVKEHMRGYICIGVNYIRPDDQQMGESWVKRYALALCKVQLGTIRSKFEGIQLLGGGKLNLIMREEGIKERDELREELIATYKPYMFYVA